MATPTPPIDPRRPPALRLNARCELVIISAFLIMISLPAVGTMIGIDRGVARSEDQDLAAFPAFALDWPTLLSFPAGFTRYFEDNFAFRTTMVRWQAEFQLKELRVSSTPAVINGRDGWLFYADDGAMEDYLSATPFTTDELELWRRALQDTHDWLRYQGIAYLFVISPDKHAIYPEFMPDSIHPLRAESRSDQLVRYMTQHSDVTILDLRPALLEAKKNERLYHRTDTHWNDRGALVAYQEIIERLGASVSGLHPLTRSAFELRNVSTQGLDLARMLGLTDVLREEDLELVPKPARAARAIEPLHPDPDGIEARLVTELPDTRFPRAVVFRDSFCSRLIPFLSEHFSRAVYLWQYDIDPEVIAREHPDVVIQQLAGRRLSTYVPYNAVAAMKSAVSLGP